MRGHAWTLVDVRYDLFMPMPSSGKGEGSGTAFSAGRSPFSDWSGRSDSNLRTDALLRTAVAWVTSCLGTPERSGGSGFARATPFGVPTAQPCGWRSVNEEFSAW